MDQQKQKEQGEGGRFEACVEKMCNSKIYTKAEILQQFGGYCLMNDCSHEKALILYGPGSSGKSTVLTGFEAVIGKDNISYLNMRNLGQKFILGGLVDKRLIIMRNMDTRSEEDLAIFKSLIAGEMITAKYQSPSQFRPGAKIIVETNNIPLWPKSVSFASWRQLLIVLKMERQLSQQDADPALLEKFVEEAPGILNWMIAGMKELQANGSFVLPATIKHDTFAFIDAIIDKSEVGDC